MFGTKRPYAFFVDSSAGPSFNCRPPMAAPMRSDESASCSNVGLYSFPFLEFVKCSSCFPFKTSNCWMCLEKSNNSKACVFYFSEKVHLVHLHPQNQIQGKR